MNKNPLREFMQSVDGWGALEWFDRLANAIENQDRCVVEGRDGEVEMWRNVAASSAMNLIRSHGQEVRAAIVQHAATKE